MKVFSRLSRSCDTHVVVLREGLLFDTDLTVWRVDDYISAKRAKTGALLIRKDDEDTQSEAQ